MEAVTEAQPAPWMLSTSRDWSSLPMDVLSSIFAKLGAVEILMGSGLVCHSWYDAAKAPALWRVVDMEHHKVIEKMDEDVLCAMAKVIVDRSDGQLELFWGKYFVTDELLKYIGDRSASLKSLHLKSCHDISTKGLTDFITKSPLLEDLSLDLCPAVGGFDVFEATGKAFSQLKHFSLNRMLCLQLQVPLPSWRLETMPELQSLFLIHCCISNRELEAILDSCPHLETLFLRDCNGVVFHHHMQAKCARIKRVTLSKCESGCRQSIVWRYGVQTWKAVVIAP